MKLMFSGILLHNGSATFAGVLYYEALREQAYQAIDELCNIPQYDDSDDNFDTEESDEKDPDQHSS